MLLQVLPDLIPADLNMEQKEKAVLYIALRDAYQKLYTYEAGRKAENNSNGSTLDWHR